MKLGKKVPSILYGPHLNITVDAGNCTLSKDGSLLDKTNKTVTCYGPSISYVKVRQAPPKGMMIRAGLLWCCCISVFMAAPCPRALHSTG